MIAKRKSRASSIIEVDRVRCFVCSEWFKDDQLSDHILIHRGTKLMQCELCKRIYLKYHKFKRHFETHHGEMEDIVRAELTEYLSEIDNAEIVEKIKGTIQFVGIDTNLGCSDDTRRLIECGICGEIVAEDAIKLHNRTHDGFKSKCYICSKTFRFNVSTARKLHMYACKRRPYTEQCVICDKRFTSRRLLKSHVRMKHREYYDRFRSKFEVLFTCDVCNRKFRCREELRRHVGHCERAGHYPCRECGKTFTKTYLKRSHVEKMHQNNAAKSEKPHLCSICGITFKYRHSLSRHAYVHLIEKPFKCQHCPKGYNAPDQLKYHMRLHSVGKPLVCPHCDKKFCKPTVFRDHVRTHTGEKPHECDICRARFIQKTSLRSHIKHVHGNSPRCEKSLPIDLDPFGSTVKIAP